MVSSRRQMLKLSGMAAGASLLPRTSHAAEPADYTIRIAPVQLEIAPKKTIKTTAFNGRIPGELIRVREGKSVTIDVINETSVPDIVHWHGLHIPSSADGASEEGSPMSAPHGGSQRYVFTARPAGFRWYHSHTFAGRNLNRATYSGEYGFLMIDPANEPGDYDREIFLALHDWNGYIDSASDGFQDVSYNHATINDKMLGFGEPLRVRQGERTLLHILNASATLPHTLSLPGHRFLVTALDGNPVPKPTLVETIRLGPAERVDAIVEMTHPGVWILGDIDDDIRKSGMGIVVEYARSSGAPQWQPPTVDDFRYEALADTVLKPDGSAEDASAGQEEIRVPLVFESKFKGYGDFDHWTINGLSWPDTKPLMVKEGSRYRLILDNRSTDIHPVHLHRHTFELKQINGIATRGLMKDVLLLPAGLKTEVAFTANNPGKTLFHCHQQSHMDYGFMMLLDYE
jgi:FtsP/CotA-like multicopper oxidase with cupredoxin domain